MMKKWLRFITATVLLAFTAPALALPPDDMPSHLLPFEQVVGDNGDYVTLPGDWAPAGTYRITVDVTNQIVTVYHSATGKIVRQFLCSTGTAKTPTPTGVFTMPTTRRFRFHLFPGFEDETPEFGQYMTKICEGSWFHSSLYLRLDATTYTGSYNRLGQRASHGCIRLPVPDARWIYFNAAPGTKVTITAGIAKDPELVKSLALPKAPKKRPASLRNVPQIFANSASAQ